MNIEEVSVMKDVERIDWMIDYYFGKLQETEMEKERISFSNILVDLMNLKFKYLGVEKEKNTGSMTEKEVRRRLSIAGVNLSGSLDSGKSEITDD